MAEFLLNQKLTIRVLLRSSPSIIANLPVLLLLHGLSGRNMLSFAHHTNLCLLNSESYMFLELTLLSCIPTLVYQLIVRSNCASVLSMLIILVVRQAILFRNDKEKQSPIPHPYPGSGQSSCIP